MMHQRSAGGINMKLHYPTNPPSTRLSSPAASLLQILFSALMLIFSLILLLIFGIQTQEAGDTFFNPLYANLIFCSLFCSAIARPATILQTIESYDFDPQYCTAYVFVLELETVAIPLAVLMLIVERVIYFSCLPLAAPLESYKHRLSRVWKVLLVALPWIGGVLVAFVKTFGLLQPIVRFEDVVRSHNDTDRYYSCHLEVWSQEAHNAGEGLLYSVRSGIPLVYLSVAIVVMVVYWNKAKSFVNPSYEPEDEVGNKMQGKLTAASGNEAVVGLVWRPRRNSCNATNNSVIHINEDQNQNHPSENNQENVKNPSSCSMVDSANDVSEDEMTEEEIQNAADPFLVNRPTQGSRNVVNRDENATTPTTDALIESGKVEGVRRRVSSQEEETTKTHERRPTTQNANTQVENRQIEGIRLRTFSQEITERHDPNPTSQHQLLNREPHHPLLEPANKTNATVGIVIVLALICACVSVGGSILVKFHSWLYESTQWLYFSMEFVAVLLAYCFPEVRQRLCYRRRTYGDQEGGRDGGREGGRRYHESKEEDMSNLSTSGYSSTCVSVRGGESPNISA